MSFAACLDTGPIVPFAHVRAAVERTLGRPLTDAFTRFDGSSFDRDTFLLAKQLMYFERYGKMFMADASLLSDRAFLSALLAQDGA